MKAVGDEIPVCCLLFYIVGYTVVDTIHDC